MSAAVPDALSFSPLPAPLSSRCAITMISGGLRPLPCFAATRLISVVRRPSIVAVKGSLRTWKPYGRGWLRKHSAAPLASGAPGLGGEPVRGASGVRGAGSAVPIVGGEVLGDGGGLVRVEGRRQVLLCMQ